MDGAFSVHKDLDCEGWSTIRATPLSGNQVQLTGENKESVRDFLIQEESLVSNWFEEVQDWNPEFAGEGRRVWVSITGIPAHAWKEEFFKNLVGLVGTFVGLDYSTKQKMRMDVGRVLLIVTSH